MGYNRANYVRIREEFAGKNLRAKKEAEKRAEELHKKFPSISAMDRVLSETGLKIFAEAMQGSEGLDERIEKLRAENIELRKIRDEFLVSKGYPADYSSVKYECQSCSDTGFINEKMCECMKRELVLAGYESSGIGGLIRTQNFETFSLEYYKQTPDQSRNMKHIFDTSREYSETFSPKNGVNLLFCGTTGLGKTHMSTSIAKVIIERGFDVTYDTAQNILSDFEYERFVRGYGDDSESRTQKYFESDLLIIDDLGAEVTNQFTISCIYNVINTRLNNKRPMIINTNLLQKEIRERYNDRITSRLFGEFQAFLFYGKDIREIKAKQ